MRQDSFPFDSNNNSAFDILLMNTLMFGINNEIHEKLDKVT